MAKILRITVTLLVSAAFTAATVAAQTSDNGDGTFNNPVLWADFPDPDVIRVGEKYYMVSTSMQFFPGVTVMESDDLVNWRIASNAVEEFKVSPEYDMEGGHRYAKGQWATSMRYFNGRFHVLFHTLTEGSFVYTAEEAGGPWEMNFIPDAGLYDPGLFVDRDGRVYVIHGNTEIYITELTADATAVKTPARLIYTAHRPGLEGNKCYRIGEYYYIFCTYGGNQGTQVCLRSRSLDGPFEEREIMSDMANYAPMILHQGCLVDLPDGSWWCVIFQDHGGIGRIPFLVPVHWVDGWPVPGNAMDGNIRLRKPVQGFPRTDFPTSDDFDTDRLSPHWQFNHNPDREKYSLTERPGWLRLHTATVTDSLLMARNTVCQRIFGPHSRATVKMDISRMLPGDRAGLVLLQNPYASLTVCAESGGAELQMRVNETVVESAPLEGNIVYLRAEVDGVSDLATFSYSIDNEDFRPLGNEFRMEFSLSIFVGNRYGIFNYATRQTGGWVDVDRIDVRHAPLLDRSRLVGGTVEAEYFDHIYYAEPRLSGNHPGRRNQDIVFRDGGMIAFDGFRFDGDEVRQVEVTFVNTVPEDRTAKLEIRSADTGTIFGRFPLPTTVTEEYQTRTFLLEYPLEPCERLELRVWNYGNSGTVAVDSFRFLRE
ncbi:MAG: glycoside hydrolase 43 family protein [Rikenellaceae bacterium]|nr:glycoside hydrolase 43 family protein [Rikenellaceae bacterium]